MGVWGAGLYSGDFAADLRDAIRAVARLPFEADKLVEILVSIEPTAANSSDDEEHTTFWLVLADQFAKRSIACERVRDTALRIIDDGTDLAILARLGMQPTFLRKRQQVLAELRERLEAAAHHHKRRSVLKKPQPFLVDIGDVLVYPTSRGKCINSYFPSKDRIPNWKQDGWGAAMIVDAGRAFEFLAWYRPVTLFAALTSKRGLSELRSLVPWVLKRPGTCSAVHYKRMELEKIGTLPVDNGKLRQLFAEMKTGNYQAINDISIANELSVKPRGSVPSSEKPPKGFRVDPIVQSLENILRGA
jgi:hypothetical protein